MHAVCLFLFTFLYFCLSQIQSFFMLSVFLASSQKAGWCRVCKHSPCPMLPSSFALVESCTPFSAPHLTTLPLQSPLAFCCCLLSSSRKINITEQSCFLVLAIQHLIVIKPFTLLKTKQADQLPVSLSICISHKRFGLRWRTLSFSSSCQHGQRYARNHICYCKDCFSILYRMIFLHTIAVLLTVALQMHTYVFLLSWEYSQLSKSIIFNNRHKFLSR